MYKRQQFAVKTVQNGLEDEAQQIVRKKYAKTEVKKDAPKKEEPKKDEAKACLLYTSRCV